MEPAEFILHAKHLIGGMVGAFLHFIEFYLIKTEVAPPSNSNCSFFNETLEKLDTISESAPLVKIMLLSIIGILAVMGCFLFLASYQKIGTMLFLRINNVVAVLCFLLYSATILTLLISDAKGIFLDSGILLCHDLQSETYRNILLYTAGKYYLIIGLYLNEYPIREGFFTICEVVCHILFRGNHPQTIPHLPTYEEATGSPSSPPPSYENFNRIVTRLGGATVIRSRRPNNAPSRRVSSVLPPPYQTIEETTAIISNRPARRTTSGPPPVYQASSDTTTTHNSGLSAESRPLRDNEAPPSYMVE
ncbi:hypothetical protein L5515_018222 [Caenorhabditis briggsae]|uniref:Uncharacterized protein n=1 Tax=Caenorhabditis briggsae TaxID=6238 RepID=A0AAE9JSN0_CAEBR|nr:hypothetical protein L5515_018222 [Caenorhabditis briggsae]